LEELPFLPLQSKRTKEILSTYPSLFHDNDIFWLFNGLYDYKPSGAWPQKTHLILSLPPSSVLQLSLSQVARTTGMSHWHPGNFFKFPFNLGMVVHVYNHSYSGG
jgi:hypothetical protein